ncbi:hypothetical protein [Deinococcus pimensis]|uniref:hypothetical protein n=1 Tax=Deinococcus pimensis TaxID=309888 RepID=UPI00048A069E|nr:hypothetical protein [Deinococcus pimensis]
MRHVTGKTLLIALTVGALSVASAQDTTAPATTAPAEQTAPVTTDVAPTPAAEAVEIVPFAEQFFTNRAAVYVRHDAAITEPVDVYLGGQLVFRNVFQGNVSTFPAAVPLGTYEVVVVRAGRPLPAASVTADTAATATAPTDTTATAPANDTTAGAGATDTIATAPATDTAAASGAVDTAAQATVTVPQASVQDAEADVVLRGEITVSSASVFTLALGGDSADGFSAELDSGNTSLDAND